MRRISPSARWSIGILSVVVVVGVVLLRAMPVLSMFDASTKTLYTASFARTPIGWTASASGWSVRNGLLTYTGSHSSTYLAPYGVTGKRYAVEASIRLVRYHGLGFYKPNSFGILFRARATSSGHGRASGMGAGVFQTVASSGQTYTAAIITDASDPSVDNANFNYQQYDPSTRWHTYRIVVNGDSLELRIDGNEAVNTSYSQFAGAGRIGLFSATSQIQVRSFTVFSK